MLLVEHLVNDPFLGSSPFLAPFDRKSSMESQVRRAASPPKARNSPATSNVPAIFLWLNDCSLEGVPDLNHDRPAAASYWNDFAEASLPAGATDLLHAWGTAGSSGRDLALKAFYAELHRLAHRCMLRESSGHLLQTTALVNEAYLRVDDCEHAPWSGRAHFLATFAQTMRRVLIDWTRADHSQKRGLHARHCNLDGVELPSPPPSQRLLEINDALETLSSLDGRKAQVVTLRFFGGLSLEETAETLQVSRETVVRDWRLARSWLRTELRSRTAYAA